MQHLNVEIKARCADRAAARRQLLAAGAEFRGEDHQIDTYFETPNGRLKLRQGNIENALIHYYRNDQAGPKTSTVRLFPLETGSDSLLDLLRQALPVRVIVDKRREIYFLENVKFHLDEVAGLGEFVEIEAIDLHGRLGEAQLREQCDHYLQWLAIGHNDLITHSYSDLLLG